jgi:hypothetical protein
LIFYELNEFLRLSAALNYQLSARTIDWNNILNIILSGKKISPPDKEILLNVLKYLHKCYGKKKRRLGPLSILHPLRATALLARTTETPSLLNILTILLHDNFEDIKPKNIDIETWLRMSDTFQAFLQYIPEQDRWFLIERLQWLTKEPDETYYSYIGRLLSKAKKTPEVILIKLVDRLDNTLDMRIEYEDPLKKVDFFEIIFQLLFSNTYSGYVPDVPHSHPSSLNGAERLYQLFKNTVLMSLIRQKKSFDPEHDANDVFYYLARASMREAQRIVLHILAYHLPSVEQFRELLLETMNYVQSGGIDMVTPPLPDQKLDGLFVSTFDSIKKKLRERKLAELYKNKPLMVEAAVAFIVIFLNFMNDPNYYVKGISEEGVSPTVSG